MTKKSQFPLLAEFRLSFLAVFTAVALTFFACSSDINDNLDVPLTRTISPRTISPYDINFGDIEYWVGQGNDSAIFIVQWNDGLNPDGLVWGYLFDSNNANHNKGINMIYAIAKADERFSALVHSTSSVDSLGRPLGTAVGGLGYAFNSSGVSELLDPMGATVTPDANGLFITGSYDFDNYTNAFPEIDHWQSGWLNGYWSYWVSDSIGGQWEYSGLGASSRVLKNHSIDAWYFDIDMSTFYECMLMGEDCEGRDFFGNLSPVVNFFLR